MYGINVVLLIAVFPVLRGARGQEEIPIPIEQSVVYSGSYWNDDVPELALEGAACYRSGAETRSYWKVELPEPVTVKQVKITGRYKGAVRVRVGTESDEVGEMGGHDANRLCRNLDFDGNMTTSVFTCDRPTTGNVISISAAVPPEDQPSSLLLCDVTIYQ